MKVCFVISDFKFMISHRYDLLQEISKLHTVSVITDLTNAPKESVEEIKSRGISLHGLKKRSGSAKDYLRYAASLASIINTILPSRLFLVTLEISMIACLIGGILKVDKIFCIISGLGNFYFSPHLKHRLMRLLYFVSFQVLARKNITTFIFQNSDDQRIFSSRNYIKNIKYKIIAGNGIRMPRPHWQKKINAHELTFCFAGRMSISKGFNEFIRSCNEVHRLHPGIKFHIAGSCSPCQEDFFDFYFYEQLRLNSIFQLFDEVAYQDMSAFYLDADIFVSPSYREGLSKAALEAASYSLPLIVSDVPGLRECIDKNGYLCREQDSEDLTQKMLLMIRNHEKIHAMGSSSRQLIEKKFSLPIIASQYIELIGR